MPKPKTDRQPPPEQTAMPIAERLSALFDPAEIKWKPQTVKGNRAMAICFIDARCVMDRLDEVVGLDGWKDDYTPLEGGSFLCRLSVRIGDEWVTKCDVGGESDQSDTGDRCKAAISDALKRTAVKFGVGRYIYSLGFQWADYDPIKKRFVNTPQLPAWAVPPKNAVTQPSRAAPPEPPEPDDAVQTGHHHATQQAVQPKYAEQYQQQNEQMAAKVVNEAKGQAEASQQQAQPQAQPGNGKPQLTMEQIFDRCLQGIASATNPDELKVVRDFYEKKNFDKKQIVELNVVYDSKLEKMAKASKPANAKNPPYRR